MSGINFNDLPKNLQQVLSPYIGIAKSVDDAVAIAKENGKWTAENEQQYTALNGGKAWGQVTDEFNPSQAAQYKKEAAANKQCRPAAPQQDSGVRLAFTDKDGDFSLLETGKTLGTVVLAVISGGIFQSCTNADPIVLPTAEHNTTVTVNIVNKLDKVDDKSKLEETLLIISEALKIIANNTGYTNEQLDDIKAALERANSHLVTIITNQENNADTAEQYYKLILGAIGNNSELLQIVIDKLTENNDSLAELKKLMAENNEDNKKILEVLTKVKYGVDKLGADNEEIKKLLAAIKKDIVANGGKLDAILALMNVVNQNIEKGNAQQKEATCRILAALESINYNMSFGMAAILDAIKNGDAKMLAKVDDILKMLKTMDKKNEDRNNKILEAIAKLNGDMTNGFAVLIKLGEKANDKIDQILQMLDKINKNIDQFNSNVNKGLAAIVKAIEDKVCCSGGKVDFTDILAKLDEILKAIKDHKVRIVIDTQGHASADCDPDVDEGTRDGLDWLLG